MNVELMVVGILVQRAQYNQCSNHQARLNSTILRCLLGTESNTLYGLHFGRCHSDHIHQTQIAGSAHRACPILADMLFGTYFLLPWSKL